MRATGAARQGLRHGPTGRSRSERGNAWGPEWLSLVLAGLAIGAVWGAIFGFVAQSATGGQRDFASTSAIIAARYEVTVADAYADNARTLFSSLG